MPAPQDSPAPVSPGGVRLRPVTAQQRDKLRQYEIDYRFVREVERLEWDGRSKHRGWLEDQLGLTRGVVAEIRRGRRGVLPAHVALLKAVLNADYRWILFGEGRDPEHSVPFLPGRGKLDVFAAYHHAYGTPAGWKAGRRAEQFAACYPSDPQNLLWAPHKTAGKHTRALVNATGPAE